jgi:hypothetical protein
VFQPDPEGPEPTLLRERVRASLWVANVEVRQGVPPPPSYGGEQPRAAQEREGDGILRFSMDTWVWTTRSMV